MSGQGIKAVNRDLARAHGWSSGGNTEPDRYSLRHRAAAAARRVHDLSRARANGNHFQRVDVGNGLLTDRELKTDQRYLELVQRAHLDDITINWGMVLPSSFVRARLAAQSSSGFVIGLCHVRGLDSISDSPKGLGRGMPPLMIVFFIMSAVVLLIEPSDYVGEIKGILAVLVPLGLYWLSQRSKRKAKEEAQANKTSDKVFEFSADKEKRLEERESKLRQEEREFMHGQIELSRRRGHILARGYMAMEMANDRLVQLLIDNQIEVPSLLLTQRTRAQVLGELKEVEDEQAAAESRKNEKPD